LFLAAVLVASVVVAWVYVNHRHQAAAKQGKDLLREVRQNGLSAYFAPLPTHRWYELARVEGANQQVDGWRAVSHLVDSERGLHHGSNITTRVVGPKLVGSWQRWTLNEDATRCLYYAGDLAAEGGTFTFELTTISRFAEGHLSVSQKLLGKIVHSDAPVPDNYVPEGLLPLLERLMVRRPEPANVQIALDGEQPKEGKPQFFAVAFRQAPNRVDPRLWARGTQAVQMTMPDVSAGPMQLVFFDERGGLLARLGNGRKETPMALAGQLARFPETQFLLPQFHRAIDKAIEEAGDRWQPPEVADENG